MLFLIPTKNEEKGLKKLLPKIRKEFRNIKIIVIDKNSTDKTIEIAKQYKCKIIMQKSNGKGGALKEALKKIDSNEDIILIDGDDTYNPKDTKKMLKYYNGKNIIIGNRLVDKNGFTRFNYYGDLLLSKIVLTTGNDFKASIVALTKKPIVPSFIWYF